MAEPRLQIVLNDVTGCPGTCPGCSLPAAERASDTPAMSEAVAERVFAQLAAYLPGAPAGGIDLGFAPGDHLSVPSAYVVANLERAQRLFERTGRAGRVVLTFALIGRPERLAPGLEAIGAAARRLRLDVTPQIVVDPLKLQNTRFAPTFLAALRVAAGAIAPVEVAVVLSPAAAAAVAPQVLAARLAEATELDIALTWAPTRPQAPAETERLAAWLIAFDRASQGRGATFSPALRGLMRQAVGLYGGWRGLDPGRVLEDHLPRLLATYLEFESDGALVAKFEAVGDVQQARRFGFRPVMPGAGGITGALAALRAEAEGRIRAALVRRPCVACPFAGLCAMTGFHVASWVQGPAPAGARCPHVARALFEAFEADLAPRAAPSLVAA